jgi:hypothetical protein
MTYWLAPLLANKLLSKGTLEDNEVVIYTTEVYYIGGQKVLDAYSNKSNKIVVLKTLLMLLNLLSHLFALHL